MSKVQKGLCQLAPVKSNDLSLMAFDADGDSMEYVTERGVFMHYINTTFSIVFGHAHATRGAPVELLMNSVSAGVYQLPPNIWCKLTVVAQTSSSKPTRISKIPLKLELREVGPINPTTTDPIKIHPTYHNRSKQCQSN